MIRSATLDDAPQIAALYSHYIQSTTISFEEKPLTGEDMASRLAAVEAAGLPWLVAEHDGHLLGFACASPWKVRHAYRHSVEISIYLHPQQRGAGTGTALYTQLFAALRERPVHAVLACIALPNALSVALTAPPENQSVLDKTAVLDGQLEAQTGIVQIALGILQEASAHIEVAVEDQLVADAHSGTGIAPCSQIAIGQAE
jgi:phosphinothricin acetyltransferase